MRDPSLLLDEPSEVLARRAEPGARTRLAQRIYVMNRGTIVFDGTPGELGSARDVEARYVGV